MSEKLEEVREKYSKALREGDTDKATDYYWKAQRIKQEYSEEEVQDEEDVRRDHVYTKLDGVGEETSEEIYQVYGDWPDFEGEVTKEGLVDINGIGDKTAESILEQVNE